MKWQPTVQGWQNLVLTIMGIVVLGGAIGVVLLLDRTDDAERRLTEEIQPARIAAYQLQAALRDQETAVRGYAIAADPLFLEPYYAGQNAEHAAAQEVRNHLGSRAELRADLDAVEQAAAMWRSSYVKPLLDSVQPGAPNVPDTLLTERGKAQFDALRGLFDVQNQNLSQTRQEAVDRIVAMQTWRDAILGALAVAILLTTVVLALLVRAAVTRPLDALARSCRVITSGNFDEKIVARGPRDIRAIASDVEDMRQRIITELDTTRSAEAQLAEQALDLQRSNAELEQFAYVASHDLQEPLRKVAAFCQLLEKRYGDKLDERGQEYIQFAVDGAKRMQVLINDLLTFSRVGRLNATTDEVDLGDMLDVALGNLSTVIEETGAQVERRGQPLPRIMGDPTLLTMLWQNLIGNAVKFHRDGLTPPHRRRMRRGRGRTRRCVADHGDRQRHRYPRRIRRQSVRDLPTFARPRRLHRNGYRPGIVQEDRRAPWGQHLDRRLFHWRNEVSLHHPHRCRRTRRSHIGRIHPMTEGRAIDVLLIEDDPGDELITREAFEHNKIRNNLHVAHDGEEGLDFLYRRGIYQDAPRPDLILLDLNLPKYDGRQLLETVKSDPDLSHIPVVILTTSSAEEDILRSYKLHANAYVTKPVDLDQFMTAVRQIDEFFVQVVRLPGQ